MADTNPDVARLEESVSTLQEELTTARAMLQYDDRGWMSLVGASHEEEGPSLQQLKEGSKKIREIAAASPLAKRSINLRHSYVWSKSPQIPGLNTETTVRATPRRGRPTKESAFFKNPVNQANVWSDAAHIEMESALSTDGVYILLGDDVTKELRSIPLSEIEAVYTHPEYPSEIWAYLRSWMDGTTQKRSWVYVDTFEGVRKASIKDGSNQNVPVDQGKTILAQWANRQTGWALGLPDMIPAIPWIRMYTELMEKGRVMTDALATFAAKVKVKSKTGSNNVGVKVRQAGGSAGQIATLGEGNELDIFSAAGKTYDFNGIRPVAAMVATAMEVSIVHLLSDPGAAGSSYGSASNLDLPTQRAMVARQNLWAAYLSRVIKWGTGTAVTVTFPTLNEPEPYRRTQMAQLAWSSGLFSAEEARQAFIAAADIPEIAKSAPTGVMLPNNEKSLRRKDIDTDSEGGSNSGQGEPSAAAPGQGQSNGTGGAGSTASNDMRTDTISSEMHMQSQIDELRELLSTAISTLSEHRSE